MFEFSRELKRLFGADGPRDGLTGGRAPLLELLDLPLLRAEARSADIAAGRVSAKDPAQRSLEAARVWRELSRRTGDALALRKAAHTCERAADAFHAEGRTKAWALARLEQAHIAMTGADTFADEGLAAAAEFALTEIRKEAPASVAAALAWGRLTRLEGQAAVRAGDADAVIAAARAYDGPLAAVESLLRSRSAAKGDMVALHCDRVELLLAAGSRLRDTTLLQQGADEAKRVLARLDNAHEPVAWARAQELQGSLQVALGETLGEIEMISDGVTTLVDAIESIGPDHSPMDWARLQHSLGVALRTLGEAGDYDRAFEQALGCFDRALWALRDHPAVALRGAAANNRAACMGRRAELSGDLDAIEDAVQALKAELEALSPQVQPVVWAICQVNLARLYETRMTVRGARRGEQAAAALALSSALDVFGEHGLRSLSDDAARALDRLAARSPSKA